MRPSSPAKNGFTSIDQTAADIILSAAFNPSGTRIALASADHKIRVYDAGRDNAWTSVDQWRGHDGEVLDVSAPSVLLISLSQRHDTRFDGSVLL